VRNATKSCCYCLHFHSLLFFLFTFLTLPSFHYLQVLHSTITTLHSSCRPYLLYLTVPALYSSYNLFFLFIINAIYSSCLQFLLLTGPKIYVFCRLQRQHITIYSYYSLQLPLFTVSTVPTIYSSYCLQYLLFTTHRVQCFYTLHFTQLTVPIVYS
jgi:hypothetical protein